MNNITFLAVAAAISVSVSAMAQDGPPTDPYGDAAVIKADADRAAAARFDGLDTNKDGKLSAEETAAGPGGGRGLRRADADGDGAITKAEFVALQARRFDMMDADHDGQLTKAERDAFRAQMMQRGGGGGGAGGPPPGL